MYPDPQDSYEQFSELSSTPIADLFVGLVSVATVLGGGLAAVYAAGYFATDQASLAWPLVGTLAVLVAVNVALRVVRAGVRRRL